MSGLTSTNDLSRQLDETDPTSNSLPDRRDPLKTSEAAKNQALKNKGLQDDPLAHPVPRMEYTNRSRAQDDAPPDTSFLAAESKQHTHIAPLSSNGGFFKTVTTWKLELLALMGATIAILSIIFLLLFFNRKRLTSWPKLIGLNTVVTILSQVAQFTLIFPLSACIGQLKWPWFQKRHRRLADINDFDEASRGALGNLTMIYKYFGFNLTTIGALAMVSMIVLPALSQQAVRPAQLLWEAFDGTAQIPQALEYIIGDPGNNLPVYTFYGFGSQRQSQRLEVGLPMRTAISNGLFGNNISHSDVPGNCSTNYCTWPRYSSVAFCSSVEDISSTVTKKCSADSNVACNFSVKALDNITVSGGGISTGTSVLINLWIYSPFVQNPRLPGYNANASKVLDFYVIYENDLTTRLNTTANIPNCGNCGFSAFKGTIGLCLNTFESVLENGTTRTKVIETNYDWNNSSDLWIEDKYGLNFTSFGYMIQALSAYLSLDVFNGTASILGPSGGDTYFYSSAARFLAADLYGSNFSQYTFDKSKNMAARLEQLTISMTNAIRTNGNTSFVQGKVWSQDQFIHIHLYWMIGPILIYVATVVFVITTITKSKLDGDPIWKSSPLALLQGLDVVGDSKSLDDITANAETEKARLEFDGKTWRLISKAVSFSA